MTLPEPNAPAPMILPAAAALPASAGHGHAGSGALFRTVRESLGLSVRDAAGLLGADPRQVDAWERNWPPIAAVRSLLQLQRALDRLVQAAVDAHEARLAATEECVDAVLVRYGTALSYAASADGRTGLPFALHGAMIARVRAELLRLGAEVAVVWDHEVDRAAPHLATGRLH